MAQTVARRLAVRQARVRILARNDAPEEATSLVDTGGKFAAGVVDTRGNLPPVSHAVANLPPVSTTPAVPEEPNHQSLVFYIQYNALTTLCYTPGLNVPLCREGEPMNTLASRPLHVIILEKKNSGRSSK
jgi:hypothetical protein